MNNAIGFRFDRFILDLARSSLRSNEGEVVLRPKSFDVLRFLTENAGRVVAKDELFNAVWPNVTVTDDSLTQCVRDIRQALGDDEQRLVRTVPRRGYLLDSPVEALATMPVPAVAQPPSAAMRQRFRLSGRTPILLAASIAVAALAMYWTYLADAPPKSAGGPPSVAVLFSVSGDPDGKDPTYDYFSDGLTDDVIAALGRFAGLRVLSRTSLDGYKGASWQPQQLARDLRVQYIVDGSVRRAGNRLRVSAKLTDATKGIMLWAETYEEEIKDVFVVQDRLTQSIVGRLAVRISRVEQERAAAMQPSNMEAYDYVLRGRERLARITRADNLEARHLFRKAAELDPRYAAASVGIGQTYHSDLVYGWSVLPDDALRRAYEQAHRAITLDDNDPAGHLLLANVFVLNREYTLALAEADRGIALNPNDADGHAVRGAVLVWMGRIDEAIVAFETAARFDPNQSRPRSLAHLGLAYFFAGRFDDAVHAFERSIGRNSEFALAYVGLAAAYAELGKKTDAERTAERVRSLDPFFASASFGTQFAQDGHRMRMVETLRKAGL